MTRMTTAASDSRRYLWRQRFLSCQSAGASKYEKSREAMNKMEQAQHRGDSNDIEDNYCTGIGEATLGTAVHSRRLVNYNSKAFRILEQLFKASEPKHCCCRLATRAERN